jgi:hypothetical protein
MTPRLSDEQREAVQRHPNQAVYVVDPTTDDKYVLLPAATFQKVQALIISGAEFDPDEFMPLVHEALAKDLDAPGMELYDEYDAHRPKS